MHIVLLILAISGEPERIAALVPDEQRTGMATCNRLGQEAQALYGKMFHREPHEVNYRCVPASAPKRGAD